MKAVVGKFAEQFAEKFSDMGHAPGAPDRHAKPRRQGEAKRDRVVFGTQAALQADWHQTQARLTWHWSVAPETL